MGMQMPHVNGLSTAPAAERTEDIAELWTMSRTHLAARARQINEEVAHCPTPIARCDVQLSKLLEERARVFQQINAAAELVPLTFAEADQEPLQRLAAYVQQLEP